MMNSTQLDLWQDEVDAMPWGGVSPRALTKASKVLYSRREPEQPERFIVDLDQIDLFPEAIRLPPPSGGAPTLLPLPERRRGQTRR